MRRILLLSLITCCAIFCAGQAQLAPAVTEFVREQSPVIALEHVRVIDGTGAPAKPDQTIVISGGKITAIADRSNLAIRDHNCLVRFGGSAGTVNHADM